MPKHYLAILLPSLICLASAAWAGSDAELFSQMEQSGFRDSIHERDEGALIDESTALEQAKTFARSRADYGLELRPSVSDNDAGLALRLYLPDRWSRKRLSEQLAVAARSEQLRIAALEWRDVVSVYRDFCTYRMLQKQRALTEQELQFTEPYLAQADRGVELNQLAVSDRARIYSDYLALLNDFNDRSALLLETRQRLLMVLGPAANLDRLSPVAVIKMPSQLEIESLLRTALAQRADYQQWGSDIRAMELAEEAARSEDGFRLKYIQPAYRMNYNDGSDGWELSAAIVLPWGTRNPDIAVYQRQQALSLAAQSQQRKLIEDRLRVLLDTAESYYDQFAQQQKRITPIQQRLKADLEQLSTVPLEQIRDVLSIRKRMLDVALQSSASECRQETLAVDLAEELGRR